MTEPGDSRPPESANVSQDNHNHLSGAEQNELEDGAIAERLPDSGAQAGQEWESNLWGFCLCYSPTSAKHEAAVRK